MQIGGPVHKVTGPTIVDFGVSLGPAALGVAIG